MTALPLEIWESADDKLRIHFVWPYQVYPSEHAYKDDSVSRVESDSANCRICIHALHWLPLPIRFINPQI